MFKLTWFDWIIVVFCLVSIGINGYIMYYQITNNYAWFFMTATSFGIFFGFYRLYTVMSKGRR